MTRITGIVATSPENDYEVTLIYSHKLQSHGQWSIILTAEYNGETKTISTHHTDSYVIDEINRLRAEGTHEEVQEAYHNTFYNNFEDSVIEWLQWIEMDKE